MKTGMSLEELAAEIKRRVRVRKDLVVPRGDLEAVVRGAARDLRLEVTGWTRKTFSLSAHVHTQLGKYTGLPPREYWKMYAETPELLAGEINRWLKSEARESWSLRTQEGAVLAFLGESYLENADVFEAVLPVLQERDLIVMSCALTSTWLHIKAVDRRIERDVPTGRKLGDGTSTNFDTVSPGIVIGNSEVQDGSFSIETSIFTRACTNLGIMGERVHRYLRDALYSGETKKLTAAALRSRIRDLVVSSLDAVNLEAETRKLRAAAENPIPFGDSAEVVQRVAERFALDEEERRSVLRHFVEGNDFTQYGLHAAITRTSADVRDYDRATQLERIGGRVLGMVAFEWRTIPHALPLVPRAARRMVS